MATMFDCYFPLYYQPNNIPFSLASPTQPPRYRSRQNTSATSENFRSAVATVKYGRNRQGQNRTVKIRRIMPLVNLGRHTNYWVEWEWSSVFRWFANVCVHIWWLMAGGDVSKRFSLCVRPVFRWSPNVRRTASRFKVFSTVAEADRK